MALQSAFQDPRMLAALQQRFDSLVGRPTGYIRSLPETVQARIRALKNLQDRHNELEDAFKQDLLALEKRFHSAKYQPLYDRRSEIITGRKNPTDEEGTREPSEDEEELEEEEEEPVVGIPEFWLCALKTNQELGPLIKDRDEGVLKSLTDIKVSYLDQNPGFRLEFVFAENDYFTDTSLVKTYFLEHSRNDIVFDYAEGCTIHWKEGKDLSVRVETKKQRHKGSNKVRTVKKTVPAETFFQFFSPPAIPEEEDDEDESGDIAEKLEADYEIGEIIREKLIPYAMDWFSGKALDYEDEFMHNEGYHGPMIESDDDLEEDDNEDEMDVAPDGAEPSTDKAPECKQQ
ncbi:hypothetical protein HKX48_002503 [Thoreauomyces humboldtii]|nr:hypothetical protein HKX48_002503 [Thoreauomyces humboldtii]